MLAIFLALGAVVAAASAALPSPQCAAATFPAQLRIPCGTTEKNVPLTSELCIARGCCWDNNATTTTADGGDCAGGVLSTPSEGYSQGVWTQHVAVEGLKDQGWDVSVEIAGNVHDARRSSGGACCGNTFNVSALNVTNVGFVLRVARTCPQLPGGNCTGKFIGWGQQLLLAWKASAKADAKSCKFQPLPGPPSPGPPSPPPPAAPTTCYYAHAGLADEDIKHVVIVSADHLDEGYHGQVTDVNNR